MMRGNNGLPLRTVWILGAGFSKALGGPLMVDLFRQEDRKDLVVRFPQARFGNFGDTCWGIQQVYNHGKDAEHLWDDGEQFLDFLDTCESTDSPEGAHRMARLVEVIRDRYGQNDRDLLAKAISATTLPSDARRVLAAQCTMFWRNAEVGSERWLPYRSWAETLSADHDTIVTFNYDRVVEEVARPLRIVGPRHEPAGGIPLLKMHGSVDWTWNTPELDSIQAGLDTDSIYSDTNIRLAIAAPGPRKAVTIATTPFTQIWKRASESIEAAQVVVFLGYRFPDTDATALRAILGAIRRNKEIGSLRVHTVLGPNVNSPHSKRLTGLLLGGGKGRLLAPVEERLFAQDFLALQGPL